MKRNRNRMLTLIGFVALSSFSVFTQSALAKDQAKVEGYKVVAQTALHNGKATDCDAPAWPTCDGQIWPTWVVSSLPHFHPELLMAAPVGVELGDAREGDAFQAERTPGWPSRDRTAVLISFSSPPSFV